ncbi:MAG: flagellin [Proteobacteria bacterium]|nr:flagellin [Pseudomonadota bacterium]MBU4295381.1 flagellin [Pseudomonadota bacterium]MCG2749401.1 flagellin [Desulfobulbaceae bacterium]
MAFRLNDVNFSHALLYLRNSQKTLAESLDRMSSGKSITKAADDAAGMSIANSLESQTRGLGQSMRNATDAIGIAQVADGVMGKSAEIIMSIREKSLQAANDSQTSQTRQSLQSDINKALAELRDISGNASYNGQKLLSGEFSSRSIQVGGSSGETVEMNIGNASPAVLGNAYGKLADINVLNPEDAQQAVSVTDSALAGINSMRNELGSTQNQLTTTINNLSLTQVNVASAQSQVADVDFAEESINFARMKSLEKAGTFAASQIGKMNRQTMSDLLQG